MTTPDRQTISLGFTSQSFPPGVHICQIFSDDEDQRNAQLKFLLSGLQSGERTSCFSEKLNETVLTDFLGGQGISYHDARQSEALTLAGSHDVYFQDDRFDPTRMLMLLENYHEESLRRGFRAARVIGEMTSEIQHLPGGSRLLEYESRVSILLREHPVTAVCQYDARLFDGAMIMDILKVHPLMVIRDTVVRNPFYILPEDYLAQMTQ